jgi:hypothetical protein
MSRLTGQTSVAVNADILMNSPFDTRSWTPYYSGLTDGTIPQPYKGMLVSVYDDVESKNGLYFCTDVGGSGVITTVNTQWVKVGSDIASITSSTFVVSAGTLNFSGTSSASTFQTSGIFEYVNDITLSGNSLSGYTNTSGNTPVFGGVIDAATGGYLSGSTLYLTGTGFLSSGTTISGFGTLTSNPFTGGTSSAGTGGTTALTATLVVSGQTTGTTIDLENVLTFTNESTTKRQVGGIPSGSLLFQSGKTIHQILQEIFYPVDSPSIDDINAVLSRNSGGEGFSSSPYQIVGTTGSITLSSVYTSGTSQVGSNLSTYRTTGPVSAFTYSGPAVNNGTFIQPSTSNTDGYTLSATPYTVVLGNNTWTGSISYNTGQQPVDDSFQPYNDADTVQFTQPGTKPTNSVIIEGVYPISATTTAGLVDYIQQPLISMVNSSNISITLPNETDANYKQRFILPDQLKAVLTSFQLYNGTTGNYDIVPIADFATISPFGTLTINGNSVTYWKYQYKNAGTTGESKIKLYFN